MRLPIVVFLLAIVSLTRCLGLSPSENRAGASRLRPPADRLWRQRFAGPAFARFHDWTVRYQAADAVGRAALEPAGVELASARRVELRELIQTDPSRALDRTVPIGIRRLLPAAVEERLEERIDGRGLLALLAAVPA
ncbi:MAG: hypothetical protein ACKPGI_19820, partial [Verrucomicrobiota bacterium]